MPETEALPNEVPNEVPQTTDSTDVGIPTQFTLPLEDNHVS